MKKDKTKKLKACPRKYRNRKIVGSVILAALCVVVNYATNMMSTTIDTYIGGGTSYVNTDAVKNKEDGNYYENADISAKDAKDAAYEVAQKVAEEGSTLLKNDGILPLAKESNVMPFGYAYENPIYGQLSSGGSAKWVVDPITPEEGLDAFTIDTAAVEKMDATDDPEGLTEAEGTSSAGEAGSVLGGDCKIYEYDPAIYEDIAQAEDTTGIVFITRSGQEGQDQKFDAYADGTPHYLALSENEKGTIRAAKEICGKVVVVLVSSAPMEMGDLMSGELEADAILWVGHPGEKGFSTLSSLLDGDVNPSGKTVDTWAADFTKDPSYQSLGENTYSNFTITSGALIDGGEYAAMYNEYMEDMYMGYRYYETADAMDAGFVYGTLDGQGASVEAGAVCYPFGYGLSYTTFSQELLSLEDDGYTITAKVKVTNTGDVAGKDVVQLYYGAPYTQLDQENKIEKPVANLVAYDKTKELKPGKSEEVTLTFTWDDLTSYCYTYDNGNGTMGCYMLEAGDYTISLRSDSHNVIDEQQIQRAETIWYDGSDEDHIRQTEKDAQSVMNDDGTISDETGDGADYVAASNQFQTSSDYMNEVSTLLSRSDWNGTQPVGTDTKEIPEKYSEQLNTEVSFDVENDPELGNAEGSKVYSDSMPTSNADNGLALSDMRGLSYDDPQWDAFLDQIDWDADKADIIQNFSGDAYTTAAIDSLGLPATVAQDGANGLKVNGVTEDKSGYDMSKSSSFGFAPLMAATWNKDLMYEVGQAFGVESLANGISGWYAPAINLHRSMFSGRVFEYMSEDPVLSGNIAAKMISGAGDQGMFCYVKHFALNETETGRAKLSSYWADEQTMRELYMKAFEIAIKDAKMTIKYYDADGNMTSKTMRAATAVMAAQNGVGVVAGECNYSLLTSVLRQEWGFEGMVISDYWVWNGDNLRDYALRAGCDTYLCMNVPTMWTISDYTSATARTAMRKAIKNLCYAVANSNAMQGMAPGAKVEVSMSPWKKVLIGLDILVVLLVLLNIWKVVHRYKVAAEHPELFKEDTKKKNK